MLPAVFTPTFLRQLELLTINSRRNFLGQRQGAHLSLKRGHGIEFFDYRKYELGDNPRHIDWGLYGRSERLYVKRFREEQALSVLMLLDSSPSMAVKPAQGKSKWEMARDLAIALSYIALMKQDSVHLGLMSGGAIPRFSGAAGIHRLSHFLDSVSHTQPKDNSREVMRIAAQIRFPGMAVFFSDLLFPFDQMEKAINILLAKNLDVSVVRITSQLESDPFEGVENALAIDSETGEEYEMNLDSSVLDSYQKRLADHVELNRRFLARRGVRLLEVSSDVPVSDVVIKDLIKAGVVQ